MKDPGPRHFSETYSEARGKLRELAAKAGAKHESLVVLSQEEEGERGNVVNFNYTIDIAILTSSGRTAVGRKLLVISSGTHGVEGYAGSAIQCQLLDGISRGAVKLEQDVILIHAVNPYGMRHYRRWNETNVDLNRNALTKEQFKKLTEGPDADKICRKTYEGFDSLFNPQISPSWWEEKLWFWIRMVKSLLTYGLLKLKFGMVVSTYSQNKGIFFGGTKLAKSHELLREWFRKSEFHAVPASNVAWIDIHTGLGPCGVDVILGTANDQERIEEIFPGGAVPGEFDGVNCSIGGSRPRTTDEIIECRCGRGGAGEVEVSTESSASVKAGGMLETSAGAGYELTVGNFCRHEWLADYFSPGGRVLALTQEFGTRPNILVDRALILENAGWWWEPAGSDRQKMGQIPGEPRELRYWSSYTRDVFYVRTDDWKQRVLRRGSDVIEKVGMHLGVLSGGSNI